MSRIDIITIAIVGICLIALIYLLTRIANINDLQPNMNTENNSILVDSVRANSLDSTPVKVNSAVDTFSDLNPEEKAPTSATSAPISPNQEGRFLVVAASFNTLELAEQEQSRLAKLGYDNSEIGYFNQRKIVAVIIGRYDDYATADGIAKKMKSAHKVDAYVHRKR